MMQDGKKWRVLSLWLMSKTSPFWTACILAQIMKEIKKILSSIEFKRKASWPQYLINQETKSTFYQRHFKTLNLYNITTPQRSLQRCKWQVLILHLRPFWSTRCLGRKVSPQLVVNNSLTWWLTCKPPLTKTMEWRLSLKAKLPLLWIRSLQVNPRTRTWLTLSSSLQLLRIHL